MINIRSVLFVTTIISFLKDKEYRDLILTTTFFVLLGTVLIRIIEGWSWVDSVYFSVITLSTIGYGDLTPQTDAGKIFTVFYIVIGIGLFLTFINTLYQHYNKVKDRRSNR